MNLKPADKKFWKISRSLRGKGKNIIPHPLVGNIKIITDHEKAQPLVNTLTAFYQHTFDNKVNKKDLADSYEIRFITFTEMSDLVSSLKTSKSPGFDKIPNILFKNLPEKATKLLVSIFNSCIRLN